MTSKRIKLGNWNEYSTRNKWIFCGFSHGKISAGMPDNFAANFVTRGWFPMDPVLEGKSQGNFIFPERIFCKPNIEWGVN